MGQRARFAGVAVLALATAGCFWPAPGAGPDRTGHNVFEDKISPDTVTDLEEIWTATIDAGSVGNPVTSNRAVHVRGDSPTDPAVYAFDRATGARLWDRPIDTPNPLVTDVSPPIFARDMLWIGYGTYGDGGAYVTELLNPDTGELIDHLEVAGLVDGVRGSRYLTRQVGVTGGTNELRMTLGIAVGDLEDPDVGWNGYIDIQDQWVSDYLRPLTLGHDFVYRAGYGTVAAGDGEAPPGNAIRGYSIEDPEHCGGGIVVCPTWVTELDGTRATPPVLTGEPGQPETTLFTATAQGGTQPGAGTVYAVDTMTGDISWSTPVGANVYDEPALADGLLFVITNDYRMVVLDADNGEILWETAPGSTPIQGQPAVAGGVVFIGDVAFDAAGCGEAICEPLWTDSPGTPAVSNGQLYAGVTGPNRLVAYGLP